jgi:hypothetical protein
MNLFEDSVLFTMSFVGIPQKLKCLTDVLDCMLLLQLCHSIYDWCTPCINVYTSWYLWDHPNQQHHARYYKGQKDCVDIEWDPGNAA